MFEVEKFGLYLTFFYYDTIIIRGQNFVFFNSIFLDICMFLNIAKNIFENFNTPYL